jgi:hypothetical protein
MKRRNFVRHASVGIVGYNVLSSGIQAVQFLHSPDIHLWLRKFVAISGCQPLSLAKSDLKNSITATEKGFLTQGYLLKKDFYVYPGSDDACFAVFEKNHKPSGLVDLKLAFFHKNENGNWQHTTTINGFQLEALVHASSLIQQKGYDVAETVLPANRKSTRHLQGYSNKSGSVEFVTRLKGNEDTKTSLMIHHNGGMILESTFVSSHCLTCSSTA